MLKVAKGNGGLCLPSFLVKGVVTGVTSVPQLAFKRSGIEKKQKGEKISALFHDYCIFTIKCFSLSLKY